MNLPTATRGRDRLPRSYLPLTIEEEEVTFSEAEDVSAEKGTKGRRARARARA